MGLFLEMHESQISKFVLDGLVVTTFLKFVVLSFCCSGLLFANVDQSSVVACACVSIHEACDTGSSFETEAIYGESLVILEEASDGWVWVQTEDGTRGYCKKEALSSQKPVNKTIQVASMAGMVYPVPDTVRPALMRLPYGARVELLDPYEGSDARWLRMRMIGGKEGWIQRGDLEKVKHKSIEQMIEVGKALIGVPYIWGGNSSLGYDCSGFVQTLFKQMGVLLPRNAGDQVHDPRFEAISQPELPGDLIFFGKEKITHVAIYLGNQQFLHSGVNDHRPRVSIAHLRETSYVPKVFKRLKASH